MATLTNVPAGLEALDLEGKEKLEKLRMVKRFPQLWRKAMQLWLG